MMTTMPGTTPIKKMDLYFTSEFRDYLNLFSVPITLKTCSN